MPSKQSDNKSVGTRDKNFAPNLKFHGLYPPNFRDDSGSEVPDNLQEIQQMLSKNERTGNMESLDFTVENFRLFKFENNRMYTENLVESKAVMYLYGKVMIEGGGNQSWSNAQSITKDTTVAPVPDHYDALRVEDVDSDITDALDIVPVKGEHCLPNFVLEIKRPNADDELCMNQALHGGGTAARIIHDMRKYLDPVTAWDNKAYVLAATYKPGPSAVLSLYTIHPLKAEQGQKFDTRYRMSELTQFLVAKSPKDFNEAITALRNARDWCKSIREDLAAKANAKVKKDGKVVMNS